MTEVTTFSVGQVRVADLVASYYGTQRLTPDNSGATVYGGSDSWSSRGAISRPWPHSILPRMRGSRWRRRKSTTQAATDMLRWHVRLPPQLRRRPGLDAAGRLRCGVLEQSWRIGGASGAEVAALEAFRADPGLRAVRASTVEIYGEAEPPPRTRRCTSRVWTSGMDR